MKSLLLCLAAAALPAATSGPVEPVSWRFAHPDAQIVAGIDLRKLSESEHGRNLAARFSNALGSGLIEQTERILMSSVVDERGRRTDLLILSGPFDLARLRKLAASESARMTSFKGLEIAAPPGSTAADPHLAWLTGLSAGTTVLIGNRPAIQAAAERAKTRTEPMAQAAPLFARALDLNHNFPVWVACETVPAGFGPKALDALLDADTEGGSVDGMDLGLRIGRTAELSLWVWTGGEATATQVLDTFQAGVKSKENFVLAAWLPEFRGTQDGSTLALGTSFPSEQLVDRAAPLLAAFALPIDARPAQAPQEPKMPAVRAKVEATVPVTGIEKVSIDPPAPAAPPKPLVVRIEGLEDGMKEIPYANKP